VLLEGPLFSSASVLRHRWNAGEVFPESEIAMTEYRREVRELQNALDLLSPSESYLVEKSLDELMAAQRMFIRRMLGRARLEQRLPAHELNALEYLFERWSTQGIGDFQVYSAAVKLVFIRHLERLPETVSRPPDMLSEYPAISDIIHASAVAAPSHGEGTPVQGPGPTRVRRSEYEDLAVA